MRPIINTLAITLVLFSSFTSLASRNFEVQIRSNQILNIQVSNIPLADQLILKDNDGQILFNDKNLSQPYLKNISFENLPAGVYFLSLEDANLISTKTIIKAKSGIEISNSGVAFKPQFEQKRMDDKKVKVAFSNPTKELIFFKVYDNYGNLITEFSNDDDAFSKTLDFSEVPSGKYSIAINNKERSFYKSITIK